MEDFQPNITTENWIPIDKAYLSVVRIGFTLIHALGLVVAAVFIFLLPSPAHIIPSLAASVLLCSFLWLFFIWAPRRTKRMQYLLRELDINFQSGYLFWQMVSISNNRIQHMEVRQGPIERRYGLATLVIYTAGTQGSELKIPGLVLSEAQQLKSQLLNNINAEEADAEEPL